MNAKEQINKLSHLLHRVQSRALESRTPLPKLSAAFAPPAAFLEPAPQPMFANTLAPRPVDLDPESLSPATTQTARPPPAASDYPASDDDFDSDVEVSSETVDIDIDVDEPMPMESGAQPVAQTAHATTPPEDLQELEDVDERTLSVPPSARPQAEEDEPPMAAAPANEIEEPTPSSSRRPIAGEEPAEVYGTESAPRHTPPPESGKQVAAPSVHPAAAREREPSLLPSAPPPSAEGHTLIGGWREPGLGVPPISPAASTGRVPPLEPSFPPAAPVVPVPAQASAPRLIADVTRPELAATANVARFEGQPAARPSTLGELLDLTLAL